MLPTSSDKNIVVIVLVGIIIVLLGVLYYNYTSLQERAAKSGVGAPLPEVKDLRLIQGEVTDIAGTILTVKVNKLIGWGFDSSKVISEEYKVVIGDKTELLKLISLSEPSRAKSVSEPSSPVQLKPVKIILKDFKKGDSVSVYADKNLVETKDFTARKIEVLPKN